jgi:hypothetical protein
MWGKAGDSKLGSCDFTSSEVWMALDEAATRHH